MGTVLLISSFVARGHVGLSAMVPAFQALGLETMTLPTVILSNHPGHPHHAGMPVTAEKLTAMLMAIGANGWLGSIDAIVIGYLPSHAHVLFAIHAIETVRAQRDGVLIVCDPVIGDDPKGRYLDIAAANAIRDRLLPMAHLATPNRFELEWLTGHAITDLTSVREAAAELNISRVCATSICGEPDQVANVLVGPDGVLAEYAQRANVAPHGTGDLFTALLTGLLLKGHEDLTALRLATSSLARVIADSDGHDELRLDALNSNSNLRQMPGTELQSAHTKC